MSNVVWSAEQGWHNGPACTVGVDARGRLVTAPDLSAIMEFDHVVRVHPDGTVTHEPDIYAPACFWNGYGDGQHIPPAPWTLLNGYSGQEGYPGPIMHPSEFIGGRLARDILATPGLYVAVVCDVLCGSDCEDSWDACPVDHEPAGWAIAHIPA